MSTDFWLKAGERLKANQADLALILGFVLVALLSFGSGYLSAPRTNSGPLTIEEPDASSTGFFNLSAGAGSAAALQEKGLLVASRGGKKYHWPWCSWGKKIKEENQIWFDSESKAKAAGYSPCACIESSAPAGYVSE